MNDHDPLDRPMEQMDGIPGHSRQPPPGVYPQGGPPRQHQQQAYGDPYANQAGMIPSLMSLLWDEYQRWLKLKLDARRAAGKQVKKLAVAMQAAPASHFFDFCVKYLDAHRPVQNFPADANLGFMLSNNQRALLCPPVQGGYAGYGGQMQDAGAVGVTHGRSQPGMGGVVSDGSIPI